MITKDEIIKIADYYADGVSFFDRDGYEETDNMKYFNVSLVDCKLLRDFLGIKTHKSYKPLKAIRDIELTFNVEYYMYTDTVSCNVSLGEGLLYDEFKDVAQFMSSSNIFTSKIRNDAPRLMHNPIVSFSNEREQGRFHFNVDLSTEEANVFKEAVKEFIGKDMIDEFFRVDNDVKVYLKKMNESWRKSLYKNHSH